MKIYSINPQYVMNIWMSFGLLDQPYQDNFRQLLHRAIIACGLDAVARNIYHREQSIMKLIAHCFNNPTESIELLSRIMFSILATPCKEDLSWQHTN